MHSAGIWRTSNRRRGDRAKPGHRHQRPSSFAPRLEALEDRRLLAVGGGGNAAPLAVGDTYTIAEDHSLVLAADAGVLANDSDPDGDVLTAVLTTPPSSGTLSLNPNGSLVYIPEENYHGTVVFGYRADDGSSQSQPASVTIQIQPVNDLPPVKDLTFATPTRTDLTEASYLTIPLSSPVQIVDDDSILGAGNWVGWDENAIWQPGEGLAQIGKPDDSVTDFFIKGASQDGSVIVGTSWDLLGPRITRWTVEEGWTTIGPGYAYGVSADGQFIVGETVAGVESIGYRWSIDTGFDFIEGPPGSSKVVARSISGDGNVVAGVFRDESGKTQVYRWTPASGIQVIPSPIVSSSTPTSSVSADGRTLFGRIGGRAFRWTEESGVVLLDDVGEFAGARPHAISRDGSVMVGKLPTTDGVYRWFLWDEQHGMRDLFGTLAAEYGINVSPPRATRIR